ncbi:MAG: efflux RND transporter periplasmic adaptor subunit [Candidatus Moranbacteria bacterium]|nr:efflux RND transporter periplasmic adaptor subunit [Candidatus Moranbacteria bacterium]
MKKIISILFLIILTLFFIFFLLNKKNDEVQENDLVKNVKTQMVEKGNIEKISQFSSIISGEEETVIFPKMSGYITEIRKKEGDEVSKGEILAVIDGSEILTQLSATQSGVDSMKNVVDETDDYYDQIVDEAKATLKKAEKEYDILKKNDPSDDEKDIAKKGVKQAEEAVKSAKRMKDLQIQSAETQLVSTEGQLKIVQSQAVNRYVKAPYTGIVTSKIVSVGSLVSPAQAIFSVAKSDKKEINISVSSSVVKSLNVDQSVEIKIDGIEKKVSGKIILISPMTDKISRKSLVKISVGENSEVRLGDFARIFIEINKKENVITIPKSIVLKEYYDNFVFINDNGIARKKKIEIGFVGENELEIISGIPEGKKIITEGQFYLKDGDKVVENN